MTADRECIGYQWLHYLIDQQIAFVIRIRKDALGSQADRTTHAHELFATPHLCVLRKRRKVFGLSLYMSGQQVSDAEHLILIRQAGFWAIPATLED